MRTTGAVEWDVEQAIVDRTIVRTWPLRGTMHFVAPADIRWMLTFLAPRAIARAAPRFKQLELDDRVLARGANLIVKALEGGRQMSRPRIYALFQGAGIATAGNRGIHILWRCAHDGLICFGAHDGRQPTFALLEEWVPPGKTLDRDEALSELARRYFTSHGPATLADFTWWSGLQPADARSGLEMALDHLGRTRGCPPLRCISGPPRSASQTSLGSASASKKSPSPRVVLLPRTTSTRSPIAIAVPRSIPNTRSRRVTASSSPTILLDGRIIGTWTRAETVNDVNVSTRLFRRLEAAEARAPVRRRRALPRLQTSRLTT